MQVAIQKLFLVCFSLQTPNRLCCASLHSYFLKIQILNYRKFLRKIVLVKMLIEMYIVEEMHVKMHEHT